MLRRIVSAECWIAIRFFFCVVFIPKFWLYVGLFVEKVLIDFVVDSVEVNSKKSRACVLRFIQLNRNPGCLV